MKKKLVLLLFIQIVLFSCKNRECSFSELELARLPEMVTVVISGDFMQHSAQIDAASSADTFNYTTQLRKIAPFWQSADFAVINLEATLSNDKSRHSGYPLFCAPAAIAQAFARAGITNVALANNHCVDKGLRGVRETVAALDRANLNHTGMFVDSMDSSKIMLLEKGAFKIAILNYTYGTNGNIIPKGVTVNLIDTALIARDLVRAKEAGATNIIVFYHWGNEYQTSYSKQQQMLGLWSRARGADVVVGSHPHVVQPIDGYNKIIYSLGNFVSNQTRLNTDRGILIRLTFCEGVSEPNIEYLPHYVDISSSDANEKYTVTPYIYE